MAPFLVYLSSTSYHWWNRSGYTWKSRLIKYIQKSTKSRPINFIDPLIFKSEDPAVCPLDIKDINKSDFVVIYLNKITVGTMLELGYCIFQRKYNWCIYTKDKKVLTHPWIVYLCKGHVYNNLEKIARLIVKVSKQDSKYKNNG